MNEIIGIRLSSENNHDTVNVERENGIRTYHNVNRARLEKISLTLAVHSIAPTDAFFNNSETHYGRFITVRYGKGAWLI